MKLRLLPLLALSLSGCATPFTGLISADLNSATQVAKNLNDQQGITCYAAIDKALPSGTIQGVFTMKEVMRGMQMAQGPCTGVLP